MRILVLAGGTSAERAVSLESGACVAAALHDCGHVVEQFDPQNGNVAELNATRWDIAIPMVHGTGGEDGVLQRDLRRAGIAYVGSSPEASELTFDKILTNARLRQHGIAVPPSVVVKNEQSLAEIRNCAARLGPEIVTKPPRQGSSVGVSIVQTADQLPEALRQCFAYDAECLVERFIVGREVTVGVVDGNPLPALRIVPVHWYDYQSKYNDDRTEYVFESDDVSQLCGRLALAACDICGVSGIARIDMRVDHDGRPWVLEINSIPGMTSHSLVPMAAKRVGLSLGQLFETAIRNRLSGPHSAAEP